MTGHAASCIAIRAGQDGLLLAVGHQDGTVSVTRIGEQPALCWQRGLHNGPVTSILLTTADQVITGSTDRSVCVTPIANADSGPEHGTQEFPVLRLHLTLRCKNVQFTGVRTDREQARLREYSGNASG